MKTIYKSTLIIGLIVTFLANPWVVVHQASAEVISVEQAEKVDKLVEQYQSIILTSFTGGIVGATTCGLPCAAIGVGIGLTSQYLAEKFNWAYPWGTIGFLGVMFGYRALHLNHPVIALHGVLVPVLWVIILGEYSIEQDDLRFLAVPMVDVALAQYILPGAPWQFGFVIGIFSAISNNYFNPDSERVLPLIEVMVLPLSNSLWLSAIKFGGLILAANIGVYAIDGFVQQMKEKIDSFKLVYAFSRDFLTDSELNNLMLNYVLIFIGEIDIYRAIGIVGSRINTEINEIINSINRRHALPFVSGLELVAVIGAEVLIKLYSTYLNDFYTMRLCYKIQDKISAELAEPGKIVQLSVDPDGGVLWDNYIQDVDALANYGMKQFLDMVSDAIHGLNGLTKLGGGYGDILLLNFITSSTLDKFYAWIWQESSFYWQQRSNITTQIYLLQNNRIDNALTINERAEEKVRSERYKKLVKEARAIRLSESDFAKIRSGIFTFVSSLNLLSNSVVVICLLNNDRLPFEKRSDFNFNYAEFSRLSGVAGKNGDGLKHAQIAFERLKQLQKILRRSDEYDFIERKWGKADTLQVQNLKMWLENSANKSTRTLLQKSNITLQKGEMIALTGDSGAGKSSLIDKIIGAKKPGIYATGKITYPKVNRAGMGKPRIITLAQKDYFLPGECSLFDAMNAYEASMLDDQSSNVTHKAAKLHMAQNFYRGLELVGFAHLPERPEDLYTVKRRWRDILSGGERKKLQLAALFQYRDADIIVLDETLNGLDRESIGKVFTMLRNHFHNTIIVVIDHEYDASSRNEQYDRILKLKDQQLFWV